LSKERGVNSFKMGSEKRPGSLIRFDQGARICQRRSSGVRSDGFRATHTSRQVFPI
jgi:hypothetical protein